MERIAVGLDGSAAAGSALRWAVMLSAATDAGIYGIHAYQCPWSEVRPEDHRRLMGERSELLRDVWLAPASDAGIEPEVLVRPGDPRDVILDAAVEAGAQILVLGRTGSGGGPGVLHLGSVVEHAAHHTGIPLAVIPCGASDAIGRIVVGVDGSADSLSALQWAGDVALTTNAEIVAVQVMDPLVEWTPATSPDNWRQVAERDLEAWTAPLVDAGLPVTLIAQRDLHPADGLLGVAAARQADALVVGTRGLGGFFGLRAGGVALKVLHRAGVPLVLVPERG